MLKHPSTVCTPASWAWTCILLMLAVSHMSGDCSTAFALSPTQSPTPTQAPTPTQPQTQSQTTDKERSAHDQALFKAVREAMDAHYAFALTSLTEVTEAQKNELREAQIAAIDRMFKLKPNDVDGPTLEELFLETNGEKVASAWTTVREWFDDSEDLFIEADRLMLEPHKEYTATTASVQMGYVIDRYAFESVVLDEKVTVKRIILGPGAILSFIDHVRRYFDVPTRDGTFVLTVDDEAQAVERLIKIRDLAKGLADGFSHPEFVNKLQAAFESRDMNALKAAGYWMIWRAWATATDDQIAQARRQYLDALHASIVRDRGDEMLMGLLNAAYNERQRRDILNVRAMIHSAATVDRPQWVMTLLQLGYYSILTTKLSGPVMEDRKSLFTNLVGQIGIAAWEHRETLGGFDGVGETKKVWAASLFMRAAQADPQPLRAVFADFYRRHTAILLLDALQDASSKKGVQIKRGLFMAVDERATAIGGNHPDVDFARARVFLQFDETRLQGIEILDALTEPESSASYITRLSAHYALAKYYVGMEQDEVAERHFKATLEIAPWYIDAYRDLGDLYFRRGSLEDALRYYLIHQKWEGSDAEVAARVELIRQRLRAPPS